MNKKGISPINFAFIGSGPVAEYHLQVIKKNRLASPYGIYTRNKERAVELSKKFKLRQFNSMEKLLEDRNIKAIDICNANADHFPTAKKALINGKHVIIEKPVAFRKKDILDLSDYAEANGLTACAVFQKRYNEILTVVKEKLHNRLGEVLFSHSYIYMPRSKNYYKRPEKSTHDYAGGGVMIYQAIHDIDLLISLFGDVDDILSVKSNLYHRIDVEDTCLAILTFGNGMTSFLHASTMPHLPAYNCHIFVGPRDFLVFDDMKLSMFPNRYFPFWQRYRRDSNRLDYLFLHLSKRKNIKNVIRFLLLFFNYISFKLKGIKKYGPLTPGSYNHIVDEFIMKLTSPKHGRTTTSLSSTVETHRVIEEIYRAGR